MRAWPVAVVLAATWPVWIWYVQRMSDGSDEPWGLVALLSAAAVLMWQPSQTSQTRHERPTSAAWPFALLAIYAASWHMVPPLVRAALAVFALSAAVCRWRLGRTLYTPVWGLALMSLPLLATLQFYLGYPLRSLTATAAAAWLTWGGFGVVADGAVLRWGQTLVSVDAPCSGIRMLWMGLFLALTLACVMRLSSGKTAKLLVLTLALVITANVMRATALFYSETDIIVLPAWTHSGIGVFLFAAVAGALVWLATWLRPTGAGMPLNSQGPCGNSRQSNVSWRGPAMVGAVLIAAVAAIVPLFTTSALPSPGAANSAHASATTHDAFPGWPTHFAGRRLTALPLTEREAQFTRQFPGRIGRFHDGEREIILRWLRRETRMLHPAADCFRGLGYEIRPLPLDRDGDGATWGEFRATRDGEVLLVRERVYADGDAAHSGSHGPARAWTDVSSWYWDALWGTTSGPWWAVTIAERAAENFSQKKR